MTTKTNHSGTLSEIYSLGKGVNQVEFRTNAGLAEFRQTGLGGDWTPLNKNLGFYQDSFVIADWVGASSPYTLTITAATHGLGDGLKIVSVYDDNEDLVSVDVNVDSSTGTIVLSSSEKIDGTYYIAGIADSGGGGGGTTVVSKYEATVGTTGADYQTVGEAITDGKTKLLMIDDTIETANITLPSGFILSGSGRNDVTLYMGSYYFITTSEEDFTFEHLTIDFVDPAITRLFNNAEGLTVNDCKIVNNSTTSSRYSIYSANGVRTSINNVHIIMANYANTGIYAGDKTMINGIMIEGVGTGSRTGLILSGGEAVNIDVFGTFDDSSIISLSNPSAVVSNVWVHDIIATDINISNSGTLSSVSCDDTCPLSIYNAGSISAFWDIYKLIMQGQGCCASSGRVKGGGLEIALASSENVITAVMCLDSDININGDKNVISGCFCDNIILPVGADNNLVTAVSYDTAVSDLGSGNTLVNNKNV